MECAEYRQTRVDTVEYNCGGGSGWMCRDIDRVSVRDVMCNELMDHSFYSGTGTFH